MITIKASITENKFDIHHSSKQEMEQFKKDNEGKQIIMYLEAKDANSEDYKEYGNRKIVRLFMDENKKITEVRF
jgi:hypothetical protein